MPLNLGQFDTKGGSSAYRQIVGHLQRLHEPVVPYPDSPRMAIRERLVRCFWFDQNLTTDSLRTGDGEKVRVLSPGWWNLEDGPDFRSAVLRFARGEIVKGDVEVHIYASGWREHGHQRDPAYNSVILHVVMWNDLDQPAITREDGVVVPQLCLEPYLEGELDALSEMVNPEDYPHGNEGSVGLCHRKIEEHVVDAAWLAQFLDAAGDERVLGRAARVRKRLGASNPEQVFYEGLMEAMGYKRNKAQFQMLASVATLERLRELCAASEFDERLARIQAVLLGAAGLLPAPQELPGFDGETRSYSEPLLRRWEDVRRTFGEEPMQAAQWKLSGVRPANTPPRRIAAMSHILARFLHRSLIEPFRDAVMQGSSGTPRGCVKIRREMENTLAEFPDGYWSYRSRFGGARQAAPMRLVGKSRALAAIANVVVPVLLAQAHSGEDDLATAVRRFYGRLPRLDSNSIERFVRQRMFAGDIELEGLVTSTRRQQGLHQVFKDYCEQDERGCRRCALVLAMEE